MLSSRQYINQGGICPKSRWKDIVDMLNCSKDWKFGSKILCSPWSIVFVRDKEGASLILTISVPISPLALICFPFSRICVVLQFNRFCCSCCTNHFDQM